MPEKNVVPFRNPGNAKIMDYVRSRQGSDYAQRVPSATQATVRAAFERMWENDTTRNQFIDALVNLIGMQIVRNNIWTNPLAPFKRGLLTFGDTIEEIAVGLLNAYTYDQNRDYLEKDIFGSEPNEVQSRFHKINRENFYKLTIKEDVLKRAFYNEGGLSGFVSALMSSMTTSDQWDEFLLMSKLFKIYDEENGFYKIQVPDLVNLNATAQDAKNFLKNARAMIDTLPFMSREYNAAHMPVTANSDDLIMITTPEAKANMDVEALAAAFNISMAEIASRMIVLPRKYIRIKGFQALLTTKDFFVVGDVKLETRSMPNPVGLITNYFLHHWQVISASPFVPAVMFTSEPVTQPNYTDTPVDGIDTIVLKDSANNTITTAPRGDAVFVQTMASTNPDGGKNNSVILGITGKRSSRTRITQTGILFIGYDETATTITVTAKATDDQSFEARLAVPLTGPIITGSIGMNVDDDPTALANLKLPVISSDGGKNLAGSEFSVNNGTWDQNPDSYTVQWYANGTAITGATSNIYNSVTGDAGKTLTAVITAIKANFANKSVTTQGVTVVAPS